MKLGQNKPTSHTIQFHRIFWTSLATVMLLGSQSPAISPRLIEEKYPTTKINSAYIGEDDPNTEVGRVAQSRRGRSILYLKTPEDREPYRVEIREGLVFKADGNQDVPFQMTDSKVNYVMDPAGNFYLFENEKKETTSIRHSTMLGGQPVAGAGEMTLDKRTGRILTVNSNSGHYRPGPTFFQKVTDRLRSLGVPDQAFH